MHRIRATCDYCGVVAARGEDKEENEPMLYSDLGGFLPEFVCENYLDNIEKFMRKVALNKTKE